MAHARCSEEKGQSHACSAARGAQSTVPHTQGACWPLAIDVKAGLLPSSVARWSGHCRTSGIGASLRPDGDAGHERRTFLERPGRILGSARVWSLSALSERPAAPSPAPTTPYPLAARWGHRGRAAQSGDTNGIEGARNHNRNRRRARTRLHCHGAGHPTRFPVVDAGSRADRPRLHVRR